MCIADQDMVLAVCKNVCTNYKRGRRGRWRNSSWYPNIGKIRTSLLEPTLAYMEATHWQISWFFVLGGMLEQILADMVAENTNVLQQTPNVGLSILSMTLSVIQFLLIIRSDIPMVYEFEWCSFLDTLSHLVSIINNERRLHLEVTELHWMYF